MYTIGICPRNGDIKTRINHNGAVFFKKIISSFIVLTFLTSLIVAPAGAQILPILNAPVSATSSQLPVLIGLKIHPENPLLFDFIVDQGQTKLSTDELKEETTKLVKYFLAALTIPDKEVWVNLSPTEKDRIIPDVLGQTTMGKTMLEQDYVLKQLASSLTNPETDLGKKYWEQVNGARTLDVRRWTLEKTPSVQPPTTSDFNKVWIMPAKAEVLESNGIVLVGEKRLKVMLDEEYQAVGAYCNTPLQKNVISSQIFRSTILPTIEKEVNEGKEFADVRQIYNSVILAAWYKKALKKSLLGKIYTDKGKVAGVETDDKQMKQRIYEQYLAAFKKGAYNLIKEETDENGDLIPRKYFSGGAALDVNGVLVNNVGLVAKRKIEGTLSGSSQIITATTQLATEQAELERLDATQRDDDAVASSAANIEMAERIFNNLPKNPNDLTKILRDMDDQEFLAIMEAIFRVPKNEEYLSVEDYYFFTLARRHKLNYVQKIAFIDSVIRFQNKQKPQDDKPTLQFARNFLQEVKDYLHPFNSARKGNKMMLLANGYGRLNTIIASLRASLGTDPSADSYKLVMTEYTTFGKVKVYFESLNASFELLQGLPARMGERYSDPSQVVEEIYQLLKTAKWPQGKTALDLVVTTTMTIVRNYPVKNSNGLKRNLLDKINSNGSRGMSPYLVELKDHLSFAASSTVAAQATVASAPVGGIDFDPTNMNLQIKRDGRGVPLPLPQQNLEQINIQGLFPVIINITPINAQTLPIFLGEKPKDPARDPQEAPITSG